MLAFHFVTALLMALTIVGRFAPQSRLGRDIIAHLARPLARRILGIHRGHLLVMTSLLVAAALLIHVLGGDAPVFMAFGGPDLFAMLAAMDAATLADALIGVLLVAGVARMAPVRAMIGGRMASRAGNRRYRRKQRGTRRAFRPDNDNSEDGQRALAA